MLGQEEQRGPEQHAHAHTPFQYTRHTKRKHASPVAQRQHYPVWLWMRMGGWPQSSLLWRFFQSPKIIFNATFLSAQAPEILTSHVFFNVHDVFSDCSNTLVEFEEKLRLCYNSFHPTTQAVASAWGLSVFTPDRIRIACFPEYLFSARLLICNSSVCSMCSQQTNSSCSTVGTYVDMTCKKNLSVSKRPLLFPVLQRFFFW